MFLTGIFGKLCHIWSHQIDYFHFLKKMVLFFHSIFWIPMNLMQLSFCLHVFNRDFRETVPYLESSDRLFSFFKKNGSVFSFDFLDPDEFDATFFLFACF